MSEQFGAERRACDDFMVDVESDLMLCRCGFPKNDHALGASGRQRQHLGSVHQLVQCFVDGYVAEADGPAPDACSDYMVDVESSVTVCRCGLPKSVHPYASPNWQRKRLGSVHVLAEKLQSGDLLNTSTEKKELADARQAISEGIVNQERQVFEADVCGSCKMPLLPPVKDYVVRPTTIRPFVQTSAFDVLQQTIGHMSKSATPFSTPERQNQHGHDDEALSHASTSNRESNEELEGKSAEAGGLDNDASTDDDHSSASMVPSESSPTITSPAQDSDSGGAKQWSMEADDREAFAAAKATFEWASRVWTQAAREAEERAESERAEAEKRASAARAKEEALAAAARRREEEEAAALRAEEERALEEQIAKAKDAQARFELEHSRRRIEEREAARLKKAREREREARLQAAAREKELRERLASQAAARTLSIHCGDERTLMVTRAELEQLEKYVPSYADKTSDELAELLPKLYMGAWLKGSK
eukprot:CAMPEP_0117517848 /NCGR_PEP_ID=MMETSP0784-20121206/31824_1 /TAXON_ID=39447 /ORGANISM="" /LENGTH=479 /DNA_ID=CAMNT_0005313743 /DNA_START=76 /DNA_END=1512 /DNA_ORIENTATION=-